jgi:hypothetical protein
MPRVVKTLGAHQIVDRDALPPDSPLLDITKRFSLGKVRPS